MSCTVATSNAAPAPWHTAQLSVGPFGPFQVMIIACASASWLSWQERQTLAVGAVHEVLRQVPATQDWPMPQGEEAVQAAAVSAWQVLQLRTSCGRRVSAKLLVL